jgi:hypothetical protein
MVMVHVNAVSMTKLCVKLRGQTETIKLEAAKMVEDRNELTLTAFAKNGEKIGYFNLNDVIGWWVEE